MSNKKTFVLSRDEFKSWLENKPPNVSIGIARHPKCCPLASYIKASVEGIDYINIALGRCAFGNQNWIGGQSWMRFDPLPNWAKYFVDEIDTSIVEFGDRSIDTPITAEQALTILNKFGSTYVE